VARQRSEPVSADARRGRPLRAGLVPLGVERLASSRSTGWAPAIRGVGNTHHSARSHGSAPNARSAASTGERSGSGWAVGSSWKPGTSVWPRQLTATTRSARTQLSTTVRRREARLPTRSAISWAVSGGNPSSEKPAPT